MAARNLKVVERTSPNRSAPPRPLGKHGLQLWKTVTGEYAIEDCGSVEMLTQACAALDRAESCRALIDANGEVIRSKPGMRDHPLLKHELAARAFVVRTLARLGLDVEPIGRVGRPSAPWGQR